MIYIFLADGFEEMEAIAPIDILRRGGADIKTVSVTEDKKVLGAHGIEVICDLSSSETDWEGLEGVILPGGMPGTLNLEKSDIVQKAIDYAVSNNKYVCAICAAPSILGHKGLLKGKKATAFPSSIKISPTFSRVIPSPIRLPRKSLWVRLSIFRYLKVTAEIGNSVSSAQSGTQPSITLSAPSYPPKRLNLTFLFSR